ncbi:thioesterase family protein [Rhodococcus erythropolis]|uniref:thioesterase family protein n=1 Tax=Rhodococcus erythropolis TaxID=1833 RepID=UPI004042105F
MLITSSLTQTVRENDTASSFGADFPLAASTPFVLGLAEVACHNAIAEHLTPGEITVGTFASIEHQLPSPIGARLTAIATLVERDGRRLEFSVEVRDGDNVCALVQHRRAVASAEKIASRLAARSTTLHSSDH